MHPCEVLDRFTAVVADEPPVGKSLSDFSGEQRMVRAEYNNPGTIRTDHLINIRGPEHSLRRPVK
jgi:hypothetical protein